MNMEEKNQNSQPSPYLHTYFLEGDAKETKPQDMFRHLEDVLRGNNHKIEHLPTGGYKIKTVTPINRDAIGLAHMELVLIEGTTKQEATELTVFSNRSLTVADFLEAGAFGVYAVRKWPPNKKTGKPNRGYTIYLYNEACVAYTAYHSPYLIRGFQTDIKISTPFEVHRQGELAKKKYWTSRAAELHTCYNDMQVAEKEELGRINALILSQIPQPQERHADSKRLEELEHRLKEIQKDVKVNRDRIDDNSAVLKEHTLVIEELRKDHADIQDSLGKITHLLIGLDKKVTNYLDITPQIQQQQRLRQADATRKQHPASTSKEDNYEDQILPKTADTEIVVIEDAEHEYKAPCTRSKPHPSQQKQMVPIAQYHPHFQPIQAEIDLNPESVFAITPTIHQAPTSLLQHQLNAHPEEARTDSAPQLVQIQSPAKRREYSVTKEVNLDENKEQKDPKRKRPSLPRAKDIPKVFFVTLPDNTTTTLPIDNVRTLGQVTRDIRQQTGLLGYLNLNGIACRSSDKPVTGRTYTFTMSLKGGMRRNAQSNESDSEEENSEPSHHALMDESNFKHPTSVPTNPSPALAPNQTTHLEHLTLIESKEEAYKKIADIDQINTQQPVLGKAIETEEKHDTQSTSGKIHGGAKNRWRIIESSSEEENVEELDPPHIAENPTTLPYSKHTPTSPLHVPDQTTLTEHWDLLEAKREAYTLNLTTDIIDDKQLTLEEAFGIDTKEDLNPIIHDEPIDRPKGQLNILQWNAYHLTDPKIQILSEIAVDEKIDIICIQEMTSMKYPKPPNAYQDLTDRDTYYQMGQKA